MKRMGTESGEPGRAIALPQVPDLARILVQDRDGRVCLWTAGMEGLYGFSREQALGARPSDLLQTRWPSAHSEITEALYRDGEWSGAVTNRTAAGIEIGVSIHLVLNREADVESQSVTEFHQLVAGGAQVGKAQIMLAEIVESTADAIIGKTLDGIVTSWNQAASTIFGYSAEEMIGQPINILAAPGRESEMPAILEALRRGERVRHLDTERRHKSGSIVHVAVTVSPIRDESGVPIGASEIARDITAVRQGLLDLEEREARLRAIFESNPDGMILMDQEGIILSFSPVAERIFGWSEAEAKGNRLGMLMSSPDLGTYHPDLDRYAATDRARSGVIGRVVTGRRKNGETFPLELSVGEVKSKGPSSYAGFIKDISTRQETESRLRNAQSELAHVSRLSAMGQMAAMLAHELNQPLTAITNYMRAGRRLLEADDTLPLDKLRDAMDLAGDEALRAGQVIKRLRSFLSRKDNERRIEPIAELIEEAKALALVGAQQHAAKIKIQPHGLMASAWIDRVQIHQVLLNLIRNSLDAIGDAESHVEIATAIHDNVIEVSVIDAGSGIAAEIAERLFDPFVTTKPGGMGIGLSICRSIIEAHGGRLWNEHNPIGGTIFRFTLPLASEGKSVDG